MFPSGLIILSFVVLAILIMSVPFLLPKKNGSIIEIILVVAVLVYMFIEFPFGEAMALMSLSAMAYLSFGELLNKNKRKKRNELIEKLRAADTEVITQEKDIRRITVDLLLTVFVSIGGFIFFIYAPETYSLLKFFIGFAMIAVLAQMIERIGNFSSTKLYWLPGEERFIIISTFQSRDFPLQDLKEVKHESAPDLLRIHPLFTFLSANQDYTGSFQAVLKLSFPGENIYMTPNEIEKWQEKFTLYANSEQEDQVTKILPIWHTTNLKRLFWKGYFAIAIKGISAYTGLLFVLIWLEVPSYIMIGFVLFWWLFNLYVSDRMLIAGTDAKRVTEGEIFASAQKVFNEAGIPNTRLYMIDSPIHNGLATGMNIGGGTIMLTKATAQLSMDAVEAILAHEAIHIKKRDVLTNQIARMIFFGLIATLVYLFFDQIRLLTENLFVFIPIFYVLMMLFPIYLSFIAQWTEVRADHLGAKLLKDGAKQMENGLRELGDAQDKAQDKSFEYSSVDENPMKNIPSVDRDKWFLRIIEFQLQPHPPLYFRIKCLSQELCWKVARKEWLIGRLKESLPDFVRTGKST